MMSEDEVMGMLVEVMKDIFDDKNLVVSENTIASDIDNWDSLNHIQLMVEIQNKFGVKFTASEMQGFKKVGDICNYLCEFQ